MRYSFADPAELQSQGFDAIIDVRAPSEYREDHLPGAINLPALSDAERAEVGTTYVQDSPFKARKLGATLLARNAADAIETHLMAHDGAWRPLVYCWRGGQRSGAFAEILRQIGWRVSVLDGGYQSWRRAVVAALYDAPLRFQVIRLDGLTGTAKTDVLRAAALKHVQTLDLEGLARHRGSILGDIDGKQPAQKAFETAIFTALSQFDPERPLLVEAESARIGDLRLPPALWGAMKSSPRITLSASTAARSRYLATEYAALIQNPEGLRSRLNGLRPLAGHKAVEDWQTLLSQGETRALAAALMTHHYDPAYTRARRRSAGPEILTIAMNDLTPQDIDRAADVLARQVG